MFLHFYCSQRYFPQPLKSCKTLVRSKKEWVQMMYEILNVTFRFHWSLHGGPAPHSPADHFSCSNEFHISFPPDLPRLHTHTQHSLAYKWDSAGRWQPRLKHLRSFICPLQDGPRGGPENGSQGAGVGAVWSTTAVWPWEPGDEWQRRGDLQTRAELHFIQS